MINENHTLVFAPGIEACTPIIESMSIRKDEANPILTMQCIEFWGRIVLLETFNNRSAGGRICWDHGYFSRKFYTSLTYSRWLCGFILEIGHHFSMRSRYFWFMYNSAYLHRKRNGTYQCPWVKKYLASFQSFRDNWEKPWVGPIDYNVNRNFLNAVSYNLRRIGLPNFPHAGNRY